MSNRTIQSALISVFYKDGLEPVVRKLNDLGVKIYSTGGTFSFIQDLGINVTAVEDITHYPSIFGGRVKTLHPKIFGGILHRRGDKSDLEEIKKFDIPEIDLVIVDLYPFEETVASEAPEKDIIEKIDIGGIALIRGAAKNFNDVLIVPSRDYYTNLMEILDAKGASSDIKERKKFATRAFDISSHYDTSIFKYLNSDDEIPAFKQSIRTVKKLRYGENPHQKGNFHGNFNAFFDQLNGKDVSYNNLIDIEAAVQLIGEFGNEIAFGILKHNNACGFSIAASVKNAFKNALQSDPISAFGGVLITNREVDDSAALEINELFFEIIIAPSYSTNALAVLKGKKNRIILILKKEFNIKKQFRSLLNGVIVQDYNNKTDKIEEFNHVTKRKATSIELKALAFASKLAKHSKSNTIVLANDHQLLSSGVGQTSRVDALEQAIEKAKKFQFDLKQAVMASDAFFPFPDCVEIAHKAGINAIIQPGGSVKDQLSIDYCDIHNIAMVFTGRRHFKH